MAAAAWRVGWVTGIQYIWREIWLPLRLHWVYSGSKGWLLVRPGWRHLWVCKRVQLPESRHPYLPKELLAARHPYKWQSNYKICSAEDAERKENSCVFCCCKNLQMCECIKPGVRSSQQTSMDPDEQSLSSSTEKSLSCIRSLSTHYEQSFVTSVTPHANCLLQSNTYATVYDNRRKFTFADVSQ